MTTEIEYDGDTYSEADLQNMSEADLLTLRNNVAESLGVASVKTFKDHATAVTQTMKALVKFDASSGAEAKSTGTGKTSKPKAEPKERKLAKPAEAQHVKRPTRKMFAKVAIVKAFDGEEDRAHRSCNYTDGMLIIDAIEGEGTLPWDIFNWEKAGYMSVTDPTDEEYAERRAAWYKKHDRVDPFVAKAEAAEKRKAEKEARAKEREEKKAAREAEKAAKAKEREEAKAKKEAEAKAKADAKAKAES